MPAIEARPPDGNGEAEPAVAFRFCGAGWSCRATPPPLSPRSNLFVMPAKAGIQSSRRGHGELHSSPVLKRLRHGLAGRPRSGLAPRPRSGAAAEAPGAFGNAAAEANYGHSLNRPAANRVGRAGRPDGGSTDDVASARDEHPLHPARAPMSGTTATAFECVLLAWQAHEHELLAFLVRRTRDRHDAEDLLQDVFLVDAPGKGFCSLENPRAWLFQVARTLIDAARTTGRSSRWPKTCTHETAAERAPVDELDACLSRNLVSSMPRTGTSSKPAT